MYCEILLLNIKSLCRINFRVRTQGLPPPVHFMQKILDSPQSCISNNFSTPISIYHKRTVACKNLTDVIDFHTHTTQNNRRTVAMATSRRWYVNMRTPWSTTNRWSWRTSQQISSGLKVSYKHWTTWINLCTGNCQTYSWASEIGLINVGNVIC